MDLGYRIEGGGNHIDTNIYKDGELVSWDSCVIYISQDVCTAFVDELNLGIDRIILNGANYSIIGDGEFSNTHLLSRGGDILHGVISLTCVITRNYLTRINVEAVMLPNIVEEDDV